MTWSSANNSVGSCWLFESLIPFMSCFCHLVIISSKYILNSVGETWQPWGTALLICTGFDILWLNCINICFVCKYALFCYQCACDMSGVEHVKEDLSLSVIKRFLTIYKPQMCFQVKFPSFFNQ